MFNRKPVQELTNAEVAAQNAEAANSDPAAAGDLQSSTKENPKYENADDNTHATIANSARAAVQGITDHVIARVKAVGIYEEGVQREANTINAMMLDLQIWVDGKLNEIAAAESEAKESA